MPDQETNTVINTLLINLDEIPLSAVLTRPDTALAQAVSRALDNPDDHLVIAGFNNFV